jgi:hypothetical protein
MNYSKAHYFLIGLLAITILAFWPTYFGTLGSASVAHHLHGITGTFWILLIASQNYLANSGNLDLHRKLGKLMFVLVPVMVGAFAMVTFVGAVKSKALHPFYLEFGQALLTADLILTFTVPLTIYLALRYRKQVQLHSALMISTVIGLLSPILARLYVNTIPGLEITGPDTLYRFGYGLHASMISALAIALFLYYRYRPRSWPWMLAAVIVGVYYLAYATLGQTVFWQQFVYLLAEAPAVGVFIFGAVLGILACSMGWKAGAKRRL